MVEQKPHYSDRAADYKTINAKKRRHAMGRCKELRPKIRRMGNERVIEDDVARKLQTTTRI